MTSHAARRADGSNPVVGSSRNTMSGSPISARATSSRRRWPPDSCAASVSATSLRPTERDGVVDVARRLVVAGVELQALADRQAGLGLGLLQHDADPVPPGGAGAGCGSTPSTRPRRRCARGSLPGSRRWWSCRHRSDRGTRRSRRGARRGRCRRRPRGARSASPARAPSRPDSPDLRRGRRASSGRCVGRRLTSLNGVQPARRASDVIFGAAVELAGSLRPRTPGGDVSTPGWRPRCHPRPPPGRRRRREPAYPFPVTSNAISSGSMPRPRSARSRLGGCSPSALPPSPSWSPPRSRPSPARA